MFALFESDSEYEWLLLIQTPLSYELNPRTLETFFRRNGMVAEVTGVTKHLQTAEKTGSLNDLLLGVVDETIKHVFKEPGAKVIYDYIENKCHLKWEEIAEKAEVFSASLERLMVSAARVIEKMILKKLYSELELKFEEKEGYEFSDYIEEVRKKGLR